MRASLYFSQTLAVVAFFALLALWRYAPVFPAAESSATNSGDGLDTISYIETVRQDFTEYGAGVLVGETFSSERIGFGIRAPVPIGPFWKAQFALLGGMMTGSNVYDFLVLSGFALIGAAGYVLMRVLGAGNTAAIFFALHHSLVKAGLFLTAALIFHQAGHYDLRRIGGLYAARPLLAGTFLLLALSLVGIPPFSGFWGKYLIVRESLLQEEYLWAGIALFVGALTFYSMMKIWLEAFWKPHPQSNWQPRSGNGLLPACTGLGILMLVVLWVGLYPEPLLVFVTEATATLYGGAP